MNICIDSVHKQVLLILEISIKALMKSKLQFWQ